MPSFLFRLWIVIGPLIYLLTCASIAALVAFPIFKLLHGDNLSLFRSIVSRGGQVILVLGIPVFFSWKKVSASILGFSRLFPVQFLGGLFLGGVTLGLHVFALIEFDVRGFIWSKLATLDFDFLAVKSLITGLSVGLLEEVLFRGALLGFLMRASSGAWAIAISSFYYAALHFIGTLWTTDLSLVNWTTGFEIALDGFSHLTSAPLDSFLGLFTAGVFLGSIRVFFPSALGFCIGVHAGWVFIIQSANNTTYPISGSPFNFLVGPHDGYVGFMSTAWLWLIIAALWMFKSFRRPLFRPELVD